MISSSPVALAIKFLVEAGGIEPPSEKMMTGVSPGAVRIFDFTMFPSTDKLEYGYLDVLSTDLRELAGEQPGLSDARTRLPG